MTEGRRLAPPPSLHPRAFTLSALLNNINPACEPVVSLVCTSGAKAFSACVIITCRRRAVSVKALSPLCAISSADIILSFSRGAEMGGACVRFCPDERLKNLVITPPPLVPSQLPLPSPSLTSISSSFSKAGLVPQWGLV